MTSKYEEACESAKRHVLQEENIFHKHRIISMEVDAEIQKEDREWEKEKIKVQRRFFRTKKPLKYKISRLWVKVYVSISNFFKGA